MKKIHIYLFLLALGLVLTGCSGESKATDSVTNTLVEGQIAEEVSDRFSKNQISDINSRQLAETQVKEESASQVKEDISQTIEQNTNSSTVNTYHQSFSFDDLRVAENDQDNYWVLEYGEKKEYPEVVVCNTREELQSSLVDQFGFSQQSAIVCADQYSDAYFQTKSLLLLQMRKGDTSRRLFVDSISVKNNELYLSIEINNPHNGATVVQDVLYHVEVDGKLGDLSTAVCSVYETQLDAEPKNYKYTVLLS